MTTSIVERPIFRNAVFQKKNWSPVKWHPVYEQVVALSAAGRTHIEIAAIFDYTPQHISNIIRTPEAARVLERITKHVHENATNKIADDINELTRASLDIAKHVMIERRDEFLVEAPFKLLDRSFAFLRGAGKLITEQPQNVNNNVTNNTLIISNSHQKQLVDGVNKLREVWKHNGGPSKDVSNALEATVIESEDDYIEKESKDGYIGLEND